MQNDEEFFPDYVQNVSLKSVLACVCYLTSARAKNFAFKMIFQSRIIKRALFSFDFTAKNLTEDFDKRISKKIRQGSL